MERPHLRFCIPPTGDHHLTDRSMQPLHHGPWHLIFNGEIYDYREQRAELESLGHAFVTEGDGEVLLHAWTEWGEQALDRINGMFALAIWHDEERELVLATDPFGEKPLFWARDGERMLFASDIRAILQAAPTLHSPRESGIAPYLGLGLLPPIDESFFAGIARLPGAHVLRWRDSGVSMRRYWTPNSVEVPRDPTTASGELRELLRESIRLRIRADVPVGTSLSGGIDSSTIVALSSEFAGDHRRHAFTARFRGFERDELIYAEAVAQAAGVVRHHTVEPTADDLLADLERLVRDQEEPFGSTSIYAQWCVMRAAREAGVVVLLDGQGADELFGGYLPSVGWVLRARGPAAIGIALARGGVERRLVLNAIGSEKLPRFIARRYRRRVASPYASPEVIEQAVAVEPPEAPGDPQGSLRRELYRQAFHTSMPALLRYADRDSMAFSVEVRLPFLDRRIAEFALSCSPELLYRGGFTKAILRDAGRGIVPSAVLGRREKVGYETPEARWLCTPAWIDRTREVLLDGSARTAGLYDRRAIEADASRGAWRDHAGIWRALNLQLWMTMFDRMASPAIV
jgi:asparagine synthase (glutamine-hydrolysing)